MYTNNRNKPKEPEINYQRRGYMEVWNTGSAGSASASQPQATPQSLMDPELITVQFQHIQCYNYLQCVQQMQMAVGGLGNLVGSGLLDNVWVPPNPQPLNFHGLPEGRPLNAIQKQTDLRGGSTYGEYIMMKMGDKPQVDDGCYNSQPTQRTFKKAGTKPHYYHGSLSSRGFGGSRNVSNHTCGSFRGNSRGGFNSSDRPKCEPRPGDWDCTKCSGHNFAHRTDCFKCHEPKGDDAGGFSAAGSSSHSGGGRGRGGAGGYRGGSENNSYGNNSNSGSYSDKKVGSGWSDEEADKTKESKPAEKGGDGWDDEAVVEKSRAKPAPSRKASDDWEIDEPLTKKVEITPVVPSKAVEMSQAKSAPRRKASDDWDIDEPAAKKVEVTPIVTADTLVAKPIISPSVEKIIDDEWNLDVTKTSPALKVVDEDQYGDEDDWD